MYRLPGDTGVKLKNLLESKPKAGVAMSHKPLLKWGVLDPLSLVDIHENGGIDFEN